MKYVNRIMIFGVGLFLTSLITGNFAQAQINVVVKADSDNRGKLLVLTPEAKSPFSGQEDTLKEIYDLLVFDLTFSGAFHVFPENPQAAQVKKMDLDPNSISYDDWRRLRIDGEMVDYVMKSVLVPRGEGQFELDVLVYDIVNGNRPIGQAYGGAPNPPFTKKNLRAAGHQATGFTIKKLTNDQIVPITETRIAFVNYNTSKQTKEIYLIDYDGWKDSLQRITNFNSITLFPDWSPNGNELAYVSYKNNWTDCYVQSLSNGTVQSLAKFDGTNNTPRWCPDGQNLIFSLSMPRKTAELFMIPKSGQKPKRLTNNSWNDLSPDVSPSGNQIAFVSDQTGSPQIYVMSIDGGEARRISYVNRKCESPFWSPIKIGADYRIAFSGYYDNQQSDIYTSLPDGSDLQSLTEGRFENLNPTWSPNGRYIAFSSSRGGKHEIYIGPSVANAALPNGEAFYRVTYLAGENLSPSWSPN
jgi:TolB protein